MPRCFNITNQQQTSMKHIVLRCGCVVLSFIAIVLFGLLQRIQAAENILPDHRVHAAPSKIQPKLAPMLPVQTAELDRGPLFIENRGQFNEKVKFQVRTGGKTLWVTNDGIVFDVMRPKQTGTRESGLGASSPLPLKDPRLLAPAPPIFNPKSKIENPKPADLERLAFSQEFIGANPKPAVEASACQPGIYNYFIGRDPKKWATHVRGYSEVIYRDVWDGIDLKLYGNGSNIEQEFVVKPGADLSKVQVAYRGIDSLMVSEDGTLVVKTAFGELRETKPRIYQEVAGRRVAIAGRFRLIGNSAYTFEADSYQQQYALVIDPTLSYSTFLGGSQGYGLVGFGDENEQALGIAVDSSGSAYVVGLTASTDFPTTSETIQPTSNGTVDAFVTKMSPDGSQLVYSTYLAGTSESWAMGVALDSTGEAYVTGTANAGFPTTANAFLQTGFGPFIAKLSAAGDALLYSTYLEQHGSALAYDTANAIAVDQSGFAYVTGSTTSASFPTTANALQTGFGGGGVDAFVSVVDTSASGAASLLYSTYLGGSSAEYAQAIAVDSSGNLYVAGVTSSPGFPVTQGAYQTTFESSNAAFLTKLNRSASGPASLVYSTFLGGTWPAWGEGIAIDSGGNAFVVGEAGPKQSAPFPTTAGAFQTSIPTGVSYAAFVSKVSPSGTSLVYSTLLGGDVESHTAWGGIAVDASGNAYVAGGTYFASFPTTPDALQSTYHGGNIWGQDAFLTVLNSSGTALIYSTYLGGGNDDRAHGIALDSAANVYITGYTLSADFPTTPLAFQKTMNGSGDVFIAKFSPGAPGGFTIAGLTTTTGGNSGSVTDTIVGTGFTQGATAKLVCSGQPNVLGTNTAVASNGTTLTATFNLQGVTPGNCDVVVTNSTGTSVTDSHAFSVEGGGAPQIWLDIIGLDAIRVGQEQTYYILVGNQGNLDAAVVPVWVQVPDSVAISVPSNPAIMSSPAPSTTLNSNTVLQFFTLRVPAGSTVTAPITLAVSAAIAPFNISSWANPPYLTNLAAADVMLDPQALLCTADIFSLALAPFEATPTLLVTQQTLAIAQSVDAILVKAVQDEDYNLVTDFGLPGTQVFVTALQQNDTELDQILSRPLTDADRVGIAGNALGAIGTVLDCAAFAQQVDKKNLTTRVVHSLDPNDKIGSQGEGVPQYISGATPLRYNVSFGNQETATAPAQKVAITDQLDVNNDNLGTLSLGPITLGSQLLTPPPLQKTYSTTVDLRPTTNLLVAVNGNLNPSTGLVTWNFQSLDPTTMQPPTDPTVGFLPPGGEGSVFFTVMPKQGLPTNTQIQNQASIVFDVNAPIATPTWLNTLDNSPPTSSVQPLPATEPTSTFTLSWSGTDVGAGVQDFIIYVSDNGAPFTPFLTNTTATSTTFTGQSGHTYSFYSIARDLVGKVEHLKTTAEATTRVVVGVPRLSGAIVNKSRAGKTLTLTFQFTNTGTGVAQNVRITQIALRTLGGSGTGTLTAPKLPVAVGNLAAGANTNITLTLNVSATVTKLSVTENGTVQDGSGNKLSYSIGQVVFP